MSRLITPAKSLIRNVSTQMLRKPSTASYNQTLLNLPATQVTVLDNGIKVATEDTGSPTATVGLWIDAGSRYENQDNNGVANFVEHMVFKGTQKRSQKDLEVDVENLGAQIKAFTTREHTAFYAKCLAKDVNQAVEIISDIVQNSKFEESEIENQRSAILQQLDQVEAENHQQVVMDYLHATAFQGTSLAQTVIGPTKNIKSLTRQHLVDYVQKHFRPGRMVLAGSGGIEHQALVQMAQEHFKNLPSNFDGGAPDGGHYRYTGSDISVRDDGYPLAHVAIAVEGVGLSDPDYIPLMIASTLIGSWDRTHAAGKHNPLNLARVAFKENNCHAFQSFNISYKETGLWGLHYVAGQMTIHDFMEYVQHDWIEMCHRASKYEVERAKNVLRTNLLLQLESTTGSCADIGRQILSTGQRLSMKELDDKLEASTADVIRDACYRNIYDKCPVVAGFGPVEQLPDYNRTRNGMYWITT